MTTAGPSRLARHASTLATLGVALATACALSVIDLPQGVSPLAGPSTLIFQLLTAGLIALGYGLAGVGFAAPLAKALAASSRSRAWLQLALGPLLMLWISHALGCVGLLSGSIGEYASKAVLAIGLAMLIVQLLPILRARPPIPALPPIAVAAAPAFGALLFAACCPPGMTWISEAGGYDALSYHLPLAMEWTSAPRLAPVTHNVYSFLPSYVEAGFMHIDALLGGGTNAGNRLAGGLLGAEGLGVIACQCLHALITIIGAMTVGRVAYAITARLRASLVQRAFNAGLAGAVVIATPWVVVVGSQAYNEAGMTLGFAAALLACVDASIWPARRAILVGLALGLATGCKPTAAFLLTPTLVLAMIIATPRRAIIPAALALLAAGAVAFAPPLIRNAAVTGNPVFPAGAALFGAAHWTPEQMTRFHTNHGPEGSLADRLQRLISTTPDPASVDQQPRGLMHNQWFVLFPCALVAGALGLVLRSTRTWSLVLLSGAAASMAWWVLASHNQSRFLLPLVVPAGVLIGIIGVAAQLTARASMRGQSVALTALTALIPLVLSVQAVRLIRPSGTGLVYGIGSMTGQAQREALVTASPDELHRQGPIVWCNLALPKNAKVMLLGDARSAYFTSPPLYTTTWDTSPLALAIRESPGRPAAWAAALRAMDISHVMVHEGELERLRTSGYLDPALTPASIGSFLDSQLRLLEDWPELRVRVYQVRPAGAVTPNASRQGSV